MERVSFAALLAAAGAGAVDVVYLLTINAQGEGELGHSRVIFFATCQGVAALFAAIGALIPDGLARLVLLALASFLMVLFVVLGALSIGIFLLIPALLALRSAGQAARAVPVTRAWAVVVLAAFADLAVVASGLLRTS